MQQEQQQRVSKIVEFNSKAGYYIYLLGEKGYLQWDIPINDYNKSKIFPIFSSKCRRCFFSKQCWINLLKNSVNQNISCICGNLYNISQLFFDPMLHQIIISVQEQHIRISIKENKWIILPISSSKQWKNFGQVYKMSPLCPSKYIQVKRQMERNGMGKQGYQQVLKNYLQYDILPINQPLSAITQQEILKQPHALIKQVIYYGEELTKLQFMTQNNEEPIWQCYCLQNNVFIGIAQGKLYISELMYDSKDVNKENTKIFQCHLYTEFPHLKNGKMRIFLNCQQMYVYNENLIYNFENILIRNNEKMPYKQYIVEKYQQMSNTKVLFSQLWCSPSIIQISNHQNLFIYHQSKSIKIKFKVQQIDFVSFNKNTLTICDFKLKILIQIDLDSEEVVNQIQINFSQHSLKYISYPIVNQTYVEWIDFSEQNNKVVHKRQSILQI